MNIISEKKENGVLFTVHGRLDVMTATDFEKECQQAIDDGVKKLVIDLAGLEYISSAGLRGILSSAKKIKAVGGAIQFCGLAGMVEEVFVVSGLGSIFTVTATADEAFNS